MSLQEKSRKVTWDDIIKDDDEYEEGSYQFAYNFPICNHAECVSEHNIGYAQGYMNYAIPFEAELFTNHLREVCLGVVMPRLLELEQDPAGKTIGQNEDFPEK